MVPKEKLEYELSVVLPARSTYETKRSAIETKVRHHMAACAYTAVIYHHQWLSLAASELTFIGKPESIIDFVDLLHKSFESLVYTVALDLALSEYYKHVILKLNEGKVDSLENEESQKIFEKFVLKAKGSLDELVAMAQEELIRVIENDLSASAVQNWWVMLKSPEVAEFLHFCEFMMMNSLEVFGAEKKYQDMESREFDRIFSNLTCFFTSSHRTLKLFIDTVGNQVEPSYVCQNNSPILDYQEAREAFRDFVELVLDRRLKPPSFLDFEALFKREIGQYVVLKVSTNDLSILQKSQFDYDLASSEESLPEEHVGICQHRPMACLSDEYQAVNHFDGALEERSEKSSGEAQKMAWKKVFDDLQAPREGNATQNGSKSIMVFSFVEEVKRALSRKGSRRVSGEASSPLERSTSEPRTLLEKARSLRGSRAPGKS